MERKSLDILLKDRLEFGEVSAFSKVILDCIFIRPRNIVSGAKLKDDMEQNMISPKLKPSLSIYGERVHCMDVFVVY